MMEPKQLQIGLYSPDSDHKRSHRAPESEEERIKRETARIRVAQARMSESEEKRRARLAADRERKARARSIETEKQRQARLLADRVRRALARSSETAEQRMARLAADRARTARIRNKSFNGSISGEPWSPQQLKSEAAPSEISSLHDGNTMVTHEDPRIPSLKNEEPAAEHFYNPQTSQFKYNDQYILPHYPPTKVGDEIEELKHKMDMVLTNQTKILATLSNMTSVAQVPADTSMIYLPPSENSAAAINKTNQWENSELE